MGCAALLGLLLFQAPDYAAEGLKALEAREYDKAAEALKKAIEADPKDYSAHFNLALAFSLQEKDAEAIPEYRKTLELKPGLFQAELNLGMVLIRQKRSSEALPPLQSAVEKKPGDFRAQLHLAGALLDTGDMAGARAHYQAAAALDPRSAAAQLGWAHAESDLAEAAEHFRKAAELDPKYKDALLELASLYEKNKQLDEAIAIYQQFPDNVGAQERLGELLLETHRPAEAIPRLEQAVAKDPTPANRLALATAYQDNKQAGKALEQLRLASASDPSSYDLHMMYGRSLRDQKKYAAAAQEFFEATKRKPDSKEAWNELAGVLYLLEDYPRALAALDKVKALGQEISGNYYLRAITLDKLRVLKPALESYQQFLASSNGKNPDEEFKARQRVRIIQRELNRK